MKPTQSGSSSPDLRTIERNCWNLLETGVLQNRHPFHTGALANLGVKGINIRTVVLRDAVTAEKKLTFYTDIRSGKWREIEQQSEVSWLFYDTVAQIQIRLSGIAALHQNDKLADIAWAKTNTANQRNYLSIFPPSTEILYPQDELQEEPDTVDFTKTITDNGRKNFGVVVTDVVWMEWLWLNKEGHLRANFIYSGSGDFTANWLVP